MLKSEFSIGCQGQTDRRVVKRVLEPKLFLDSNNKQLMDEKHCLFAAAAGDSSSPHRSPRPFFLWSLRILRPPSSSSSCSSILHPPIQSNLPPSTSIHFIPSFLDTLNKWGGGKRGEGRYGGGGDRFAGENWIGLEGEGKRPISNLGRICRSWDTELQRDEEGKNGRIGIGMRGIGVGGGGEIVVVGVMRGE